MKDLEILSYYHDLDKKLDLCAKRCEIRNERINYLLAEISRTKNKVYKAGLREAICGIRKLNHDDQSRTIEQLTRGNTWKKLSKYSIKRTIRSKAKMERVSTQRNMT